MELSQISKLQDEEFIKALTQLFLAWTIHFQRF